MNLSPAKSLGFTCSRFLLEVIFCLFLVISCPFPVIWLFPASHYYDNQDETEQIQPFTLAHLISSIFRFFHFDLNIISSSKNLKITRKHRTYCYSLQPPAEKKKLLDLPRVWKADKKTKPTLGCGRWLPLMISQRDCPPELLRKAVLAKGGGAALEATQRLDGESAGSFRPLPGYKA